MKLYMDALHEITLDNYEFKDLFELVIFILQDDKPGEINDIDIIRYIYASVRNNNVLKNNTMRTRIR